MTCRFESDHRHQLEAVLIQRVEKPEEASASESETRAMLTHCSSRTWQTLGKTQFAAHLAQMIHPNPSQLAAYAEGLTILRGANIGKQQGDANAETTPLREQ